MIIVIVRSLKCSAVDARATELPAITVSTADATINFFEIIITPSLTFHTKEGFNALPWRTLAKVLRDFKKSLVTFTKKSGPSEPL